MPQSDRDVSRTFAVVLVGACTASVLVTLRAIGDAAISLIIGGLLFVSVIPFCRSPRSGTGQRRSSHVGSWRP